MAEQDRKRPKVADPARGKGKQPITRHPLFPATVAIWFGALFGLGSLAIRPSLLESFIISSGIDAIVPAAAPPLGMTARILMALALAGLGGLIGAMIARRMARPKVQRRERSRGMASVLGRKVSAADTNVRRRPLAVDDEFRRPDFEERAPLPGGARHILNVSEFAFDDLADAPADTRDAGQPARSDAEPPAEPAPMEASAGIDDALDLGTFGAAPAAETGLCDVDAPAQSGPDFTAGQTFVTHDEPVPPETPEADAAGVVDADRSIDLAALNAPATPRAFAAPPPARPFSRPADDDAAISAQASVPPRGEVADAEPSGPGADEISGTTEPAPTDAVASRRPDVLARLCATETAPPLFSAPRTSTHPAEPAAPPTFARLSDEPDIVAHAAEPLPEMADGSTESRAKAAGPASQPTIQGIPMPDDSAANRIASANLEELSHVELLERLAISLKRRRQRRADAPADTAQDEPVADPVPCRQQPVVEPHETASAVVMPAALRPVALDDIDEDETLPGFVPPRHIAMPSANLGNSQEAGSKEQHADVVINIAPVPSRAPLQSEPEAPCSRPFAKPFDPPVTSDDEPDEDAGEADQVLEGGYSSLLDLSRPAAAPQHYVRIDEPEPDAGAIEPVVIFPNQVDVRAAAPEAPARPEMDGEAEPAAPASSATRPFDAPGSAAAQGIAAPLAQQDAAETERALRAALASLQRMSGAA